MQKHNTATQTLAIPHELSVSAVLISALFLSLQMGTITIAAPVAMVYILFFSKLLGKAYFPNNHPETQWLMGALMMLGYYTCVLTSLFYFYELNAFVFGLITALSPLLVLTHMRVLKKTDRIEFSFRYPSPTTTLGLGSITILAGLLFFLMMRSRTLSSAVTPWSLMPAISFVIYGVLICISMASIIYSDRAGWKRLIPAYALSLCVLAIIFPLGYGFDPFIHHATEQLLLTHNTIQPRPFYYVGYYSLVVWLVRIVHIPLANANTYLNLILCAVLVPLAASSGLRYIGREKKFSLIAALSILLLPYAYMVQSTPQAASYLLALLFMFTALHYATDVLPWWPLAGIAITATAMHPLTGIPLAIMAFFFLAYQRTSLSSTVRMTFLSLIVAAGIVMVPSMLVIAALRSGEFSIHFGFYQSISLWQPFLPSVFRFTNIDDLLYSFIQSAGFLWIIISLSGYALADKAQKKNLRPFLIMSGTMLCAYVGMRTFMQFDFSTEIESNIFAQRIAMLCLITLAPLALYFIVATFSRASTMGRQTMLIAVLLLSLGITASWYGSFPRFDTRDQNKGYSASASDYDAVQWIHADAGSHEYVVLADQTVSAVALQSYGFAQYHNGLLYYPIPTNGPLYQKFLKVMTIDHDQAQHALDETRAITGVQAVYVVLNEYWDSSEKIRTALQTGAARTHVIDEKTGRVDIFIFEANETTDRYTDRRSALSLSR